MDPGSGAGKTWRLKKSLCVVLLLLFFSAFTVIHPENPPVAHTGGFGEPTCHTCHFDGSLNDGLADVSLHGIGSSYHPEQRYKIQVSLKRADMGRAGFQLSMRDIRGHQAGTFIIEDDRLAVDTANGIQYIRHSPEGTLLVDDDSVAWRFTWQAPDSINTVLLHLSANAANGDESEFGDAIYQVEQELTVIE